MEIMWIISRFLHHRSTNCFRIERMIFISRVQRRTILKFGLKNHCHFRCEFRNIVAVGSMAVNAFWTITRDSAVICKALTVHEAVFVKPLRIWNKKKSMKFSKWTIIGYIGITIYSSYTSVYWLSPVELQWISGYRDTSPRILGGNLIYLSLKFWGVLDW